MNNNYTQVIKRLIPIGFILVIMTSGVNAQLILERDLIGAVAATSTNISDGNTQQLQVDASFGESLVGYKKGDIIITVGFHQAEDFITIGGAGNVSPEDEGDNEGAAKILVNAYPNPTVEKLTVDLGAFQEEFKEIRLIDISGRTVKISLVAGHPLIIFTQLDRLPSATYFLLGMDWNGKLHQLSSVVIAKD